MKSYTIFTNIRYSSAFDVIHDDYSAHSHLTKYDWEGNFGKQQNHSYWIQKYQS